MEVVSTTSVGSSSSTPRTPPGPCCACVLPISYLCVCIIGVVSYYDTYVPTYLPVPVGRYRRSASLGASQCP